MNGTGEHDAKGERRFSAAPAADDSAGTNATIVVPTFEARATLERALRSALDQTLRNIEVIVVDDAS
ncbi:MAG: hypothetical protein JWM91_2013, partial [Rhodospirillales bacterium]|nr:hypothetical protein [Rhodospirillales bacterium]